MEVSEPEQTQSVQNVLRGERGFTVVELLYTTSIVAILVSISLTAFYVYKEDVEYAKAEADLRNARLAMEVGDQESSAGTSVPLTSSVTTGGPLASPLDGVMPGAVVSKDVLLQARYNNCAGQTGLTMNQQLIVEPCKGSRYTSYQKFCNGLEVLQRIVALSSGGAC